MQEIQVARAEKEFMRWVILSALSRAEPYGANEHVIARTVQDIPLRGTSDVVRRELAYLEGHTLVQVEKTGIWAAKLTAKGSDFVDYRAEDIAGIARPPQWS